MKTGNKAKGKAKGKAKDFYSILEVNPAATDSELKKAYRALMKIWHPDVCKQENAYEIFSEIQRAYETLSDPEQRQAYDRSLGLYEEDSADEESEEKKTSFLGCLTIILLTMFSLGFVAYIAFKVYMTLHGNNSGSTP